MKVRGDVERLSAHLGLWSLSFLERNAIEGDSPVNEISMVIAQAKSSVSWIGGMKTAQLRANFKYWSKSDSALVL